MWTIKWIRCIKPFPHVSQTYGFSPVCILKWRFNDDRWLYCFEQKLQEYGFSPLCVLWCFLKFDFRLNSFPHVSHFKGLLTVWGLHSFSLAAALVMLPVVGSDETELMTDMLTTDSSTVSSSLEYRVWSFSSSTRDNINASVSCFNVSSSSSWTLQSSSCSSLICGDSGSPRSRMGFLSWSQGCWSVKTSSSSSSSSSSSRIYCS